MVQVFVLSSSSVFLSSSPPFFLFGNTENPLYTVVSSVPKISQNHGIVGAGMDL